MDILTAANKEFLIDLLLALFCGLLVGGERELKKKPAGVSTQTLVIGASMIFAFISRNVGGDPTRIAAQIVSGVGFLGAGLILRNEGKKGVSNVTTAASIWFSAAIGMALGYNYHFIALTSAFYVVIVSRIPRISTDD